MMSSISVFLLTIFVTFISVFLPFPVEAGWQAQEEKKYVLPAPSEKQHLLAAITLHCPQEAAPHVPDSSDSGKSVMDLYPAGQERDMDFFSRDSSQSEQKNLTRSEQKLRRLALKNWSFFWDDWVSPSLEEEIDAALIESSDAGLRYTLSPDLRASVGMFVTRQEAGVEILPVMGLEWKRTAREGLSGYFGLPETALIYRLSPALAYRLGIRYDNALYRLMNDEIIPQWDMFQADEDIMAGLYFDNTPQKYFFFTVGLQYYLLDGEELSIDEAYCGFMRLMYSF